jgi:hypothetical protein
LGLPDRRVQCQKFLEIRQASLETRDGLESHHVLDRIVGDAEVANAGDEGFQAFERVEVGEVVVFVRDGDDLATGAQSVTMSYRADALGCRTHRGLEFRDEFPDDPGERRLCLLVPWREDLALEKKRVVRHPL